MHESWTFDGCPYICRIQARGWSFQNRRQKASESWSPVRQGKLFTAIEFMTEIIDDCRSKPETIAQSDFSLFYSRSKRRPLIKFWLVLFLLFVSRS